MADPADLLKSAQGAIRDIGAGAASLASGPAQAAEQARAVANLVGQAADSMRAQAIAFRAASASLAQVAELLEQQVELIDAVRDPLGTLRAAGESIRKGAGGDSAKS